MDLDVAFVAPLTGQFISRLAYPTKCKLWAARDLKTGVWQKSFSMVRMLRSCAKLSVIASHKPGKMLKGAGTGPGFDFGIWWHFQGYVGTVLVAGCCWTHTKCNRIRTIAGSATGWSG